MSIGEGNCAMGAGRYVGRVGGLAVALGIGTAVFTGHGVASATTDSDASPTHTETHSGQTTHRSPSKGPAVASKADDAEGKVVKRPLTRPDTPRQTTAGGRHRLAPSKTPSSAPVTAQSNSGSAPATHRPGSGVPKHALDDPTVPEPQPSPTTEPADSTAVKTTSDSPAIETAVPSVLNSEPGSAPTEPTRNTPAISTLLAGARRELGTDSTITSLIAPQSLTTSSTAIQYAPTVAITKNVITGTNTAATTINGNPITYYSVSAAADGGKLRIDSATGNFAILPYQTALTSGSETYSVLAAETTPFDAALTGIPLLGPALFLPVLLQLYQLPVVNVILAPVIGTSTKAPVTVTPSALNTTGDPLAFTVMVTSFDGTKISTNYFPSSGLTTQHTAPTIFNGSGAATRAVINPFLRNPEVWLGVQELRDAGYNVVTWDPRGEFYSGGVLNLDSAQFEGRDVSAIIDFVARLSTTQRDAPGDPRMGMVGGSYGGAIQFVTAAADSRVDALAPQIAFNNLQSLLAPYDGAVRTSYALLLLLNFIVTGARINPALAPGILIGALTGQIPGFAQSLVDNAGPGALTQDVHVPTLLIQGIPDPIFPLEQSMINARMLEANGVPLKMIWYCGGHGTCLTPPGDDPDWVDRQTLEWMNKYVKEQDVDTGAAFRWVDQNGDYYSSNVLPTDADFYGTALVTNGSGALLPIIPVIGGSGPSIASIPYSLGDGSPARNAVNVPITNPTETTQVVGAPTLTMTYSGIGTGRVVYGQIVDRKNGLVVGNQVSPVPVTLDGDEHTVSVPLADIVYTMAPDSDLELQIVSFATAWASFTQFGAINVQSVRLELPTAADATEEFATPVSA
jgi:ABC-2 type transport system ATP-binding protein